MSDNLIITITFDQDKELAESFYQNLDEHEKKNPSVSISWQRPIWSIGALESVIQVLGNIDYSVSGAIAIGVISNAIYDFIKKKYPSQAEKTLPIEIVLKGKFAKATIRTSMTKEQIQGTLNNLVNSVLKSS